MTVLSWELEAGSRKPVVILVDSIVSRALIIQSMEKYKKSWEEEEIDQQVYINDYIPPDVREYRRREREIYRDNEKDSVNKINMQFVKGSLKVQGEDFKPTITAPDPTKVLTYTEAQLDSIYATDLQNAGQTLTYEGSSFTAYAVPANSHLLVDNAYMKLRLKFPRARHILLGYSIPGMPRFRHEEYCDDKEIGGGKVIMNIIKRNKLSNIAIFVVRVQKGDKIGPKRFDMIRQAVESVMKL